MGILRALLFPMMQAQTRSLKNLIQEIKNAILIMEGYRLVPLKDKEANP